MLILSQERRKWLIMRIWRLWLRKRARRLRIKMRVRAFRRSTKQTLPMSQSLIKLETQKAPSPIRAKTYPLKVPSASKQCSSAARARAA